MNGVQIEYLLGLYFLVESISVHKVETRYVPDVDHVRFVAAVLLLVAAFLSKALIG